MILIIISAFILLIVILIWGGITNWQFFPSDNEPFETSKFSNTSTTKKCGKEGHFSHSSGGGKFSWNAIRVKNSSNMINPYLFTMFETYRDGTSDHYLVDTIDLPSMKVDVITADGIKGVLYGNNLSYGVPDTKSLKTIAKAQKKFFDMLPCYSGSYSGKGTQ